LTTAYFRCKLFRILEGDYVIFTWRWCCSVEQDMNVVPHCQSYSQHPAGREKNYVSQPWAVKECCPQTVIPTGSVKSLEYVPWMITPPGSLPRNVFGRPFLHCKWRALDISDLHRQSIVGHFMIGITILGRNTIQIKITYNSTPSF